MIKPNYLDLIKKMILKMRLGSIKIKVLSNNNHDHFNEMSLKYNQNWKLYDDGKTGGLNNCRGNMENIDYSYFFVNSPKTNSYCYNFTKHVLVEELVQSLGFPNDSWAYENSMFYDGFIPYGSPTTLSELDKEVINILYNENVK